MNEQVTFDPNCFGTPEAIGKLATKLSEVMSAVGRIEKRGHNAAFNYDFVLEGDVLGAISKELAARRVALVPYLEDSSAYDQPGRNGALHVAVLRYRFTFIDGDTGASIVARIQSEGLDTQDKASSKALTSAVKTFLLKQFLIPTGDDPDAHEPAAPPARARAAAAPRPTPAPSMASPTPPAAATAPAPAAVGTGTATTNGKTPDPVNRAVQLWGKNAKRAGEFKKANGLSDVLTNWSTEQLTAFIEHMEAGASTAPAAYRAP